MKNLKLLGFLMGSLFSISVAVSQELKIIETSAVNINQLPEYVIITCENTKLLGGINIMIDYKRSAHKDKLETLEELLQSRKKLRIRNQTDLLNAMAQLGYDYLDAFNATAGTIGAETGNDVEVFGSEAKYRVNIVFRKKEQYRN